MKLVEKNKSIVLADEERLLWRVSCQGLEDSDGFGAEVSLSDLLGRSFIQSNIH